MLGLPGGFARNFNMWGGGGVGVGDAITFLEFAHMLYATPRQRWCVNFRCFYVIMVRCWCVHVYTWYVAGVSCGVGVGLGWGCNHVSWICTHTVCYATATLVCELSVFLCNHGTLLVCSCVHMVRCWCVMWGGGGVGVGMQSRFLEFAHILYATPRQRWYVNFRCFYVISNHGTLLVCSCVHMVRCWCVMCSGVGVGVGMQSRFLNLHTCCMLRHGIVGMWTFGVFM